MTGFSLALGAPFSRRERGTLGLVSGAHAFSHFYMLLLPPIFPLLHAELALSYASLGLLLSVYAVVTGLMQIPMGMLVDRIGGQTVLALGLALNGLAIALVGVIPLYSTMLACMVLAGVGNAVFHPADYAILSARVQGTRIGRAFSLHLFAGYIGWVLAPPAVLGLTLLAGWRAALFLLGALGVLYAAGLVLGRRALDDQEPRARAHAEARTRHANGERTGLALLLTPVIASLFIFYMAVAMAGSGIQSFSVVAMMDLHGISLASANVALTGYFVAAATGTLLGGWVADSVRRHEAVTAAAFICSACFVAALAIPGISAPGVTVLLVLAGFFIAIVAPLRDVMVRQAAPAGSVGTAFGIVTTGFSAGFTLAPLLLGCISDQGRSEFVFLATTAMTLLGVLTLGGVGLTRSRARGHERTGSASPGGA